MAREKAERPEDLQTEQPHLSVAELRQLIKLMNSSEIEEIGIEEATTGLRLSLRKPAPITVAGGADDEMFDALIIEEAEGHAEPLNVEIKASMVGIFRSAMKAGGKPLVAVGDIIREGQVVGAVESLTVRTEVEAATAGRICAIFVHEGQPVEYGQPLMEIQPNR